MQWKTGMTAKKLEHLNTQPLSLENVKTQYKAPNQKKKTVFIKNC